MTECKPIESLDALLQWTPDSVDEQLIGPKWKGPLRRKRHWDKGTEESRRLLVTKCSAEYNIWFLMGVS